MWSDDHYIRPIEWLVLSDPSYIIGTLDRPILGEKMLEQKQEIIKLLRIFDSKRIILKCDGCEKDADMCSVYIGTVRLKWWCEDCDPYSHGAFSGKLKTIKTYGEALNYCKNYANNKTNFNKIIIEIARAKGLPKRASNNAKLDFFANKLNT